MAIKNKRKFQTNAGKIKIKKGDKVFVISGSYKDRSKAREVLEVFPTKNRAIVEDVNIAKKHTKPTQNNPGGINEIPTSIHISNLMLADPKDSVPTRVGRRVEDGKLVRFSKKSGEILR
jgi:large subunit ribosomal protein L24